MEQVLQSSLFALRGDLDGEDKGSYTDVREFIGLVVANEEFLLDVQNINEIIVVPNITFVPGSPYYITGVINLRGSIIPTIDLRQLFSVKAENLTPAARVIVTEHKGVSIGMIVDSITYVVQVRPESLSQATLSSKTGPSEYLSGMCNRSESVNGVLDVEKVIHKVSGGSLQVEEEDEE